MGALQGEWLYRRLQEAWEGEQTGAERLVREIGGMDDYSPANVVPSGNRLRPPCPGLLPVANGSLGAGLA